jgi:hypothetical protein
VELNLPWSHVGNASVIWHFASWVGVVRCLVRFAQRDVRRRALSRKPTANR